MTDDGDASGAHEVGPLEDDSQALLLRLRDLVDEARQMPLSASVMINRDEFAELIDAALAALPEELKQSRWLLRERDEVRARARREGDELIEAARVRAGRMVERTEVVREAQRTAQRVLDAANEEAGQLMSEAEDYIDQKLAAFEVVLERTIATVQSGRDRLQVHTGSPQLDEELEASEEDDAFFDQDIG